MSIRKLFYSIRKQKTINRIAAWLFTSVCGGNTFSVGKNTFLHTGAYIRRSGVKIRGTNNTVIIESGCHLRQFHLTICGNNNEIRIGKNVSASQLTIVVDDEQNTVSIGSHTVISGKTHIACIEGTSVAVGENCLFSEGITLRSGDSHSVVDENRQRINPSKSIAIGDHVWIGNTVSVLKGVSVGENCIIGTGSIVTKTFDGSGLLIAGNPASVKKDRINWTAERIR